MSRKVLMTRATGYVARQIVPRFEKHYELTLLDIEAVEGGPGIMEFDLIEGDRNELTEIMRGHDTVVHCANIPPRSGYELHDTGMDAQAHALCDVERVNVNMMQTIFQVTMQTGVERVVAASSNQAARWYEQPYCRGLKSSVSPEEYPSP